MLNDRMSNRTRSGMLAALCLTLLSSSALAKDKVRMNPLADFVKVTSGGYRNGNRVLIQIGEDVLVDERSRTPATTGIHLVAILNRRVIHQFNYNTHYVPGASEGLARDIASFTNGTLVIVAVKAEATRRFDKRGQAALLQIGAKTGLYKQTNRTSYICIGTKGLAPGEAIEKIGMELLIHEGSKVGKPYKLSFPSVPKPKISSRPGLHEDLTINETEILYYIPTTFDAQTGRYLFLIHGGEDWHRDDALRLIDLFKNVAHREKLVLVAPVFDCVTNWKVTKADLNEIGHFRDLRIMKAVGAMHFVSFLHILAKSRPDSTLIDAFNCFNEQLMKRDSFNLHGRGKGAEFVCCFLYFHPELVDHVALSDASLLTLPDRNLDYPHGMKTKRLPRRYRQFKVDDLDLTDDEYDEKLSKMLSRSVYVVAPGSDSATYDEVAESKPASTKPSSESASQTVFESANTEPAGTTDTDDKPPLEVARCFVEAMRAEYNRLSKAGKQSQNDTFRIELHTVSETNVDNGVNKAIELLFPGPTAVKN